MFGINIGIEAYNGIKLHRKDGTEYWKLRLTCAHEGCPNEIEMGECLCFGTEEAMAKARDAHGMHCSAMCWVADNTEVEVAKGVATALRALNELTLDERHMYDVYDQLDICEVIDGYWSYLAEMGDYDGSYFYEQYDVEDCPI